MTEYAMPVPYSAVGLHADAFRKKVNQLAIDLPIFMAHCRADAVVVTGTSGMSVAFALRMITDIPTMILRKPGEDSHSSDRCAMGLKSIDINRYIILDDFTDSGSTINRITDRVCARLVGLFFYSRGSDRMFVTGPENSRWAVPTASGEYGVDYPGWRPLDVEDTPVRSHCYT
jgi:adenine/guanine phosphoribosyltransferase-like PRPP-binding protein